MVSFAVFLGGVFVLWRRDPAGRRDRGLVIRLVVGLLVLAVGAIAFAATL